jgi:hypothetical protein
MVGLYCRLWSNLRKAMLMIFTEEASEIAIAIPNGL